MIETCLVTPDSQEIVAPDAAASADRESCGLVRGYPALRRGLKG
jgi:hypothetical protein